MKLKLLLSLWRYLYLELARERAQFLEPVLFRTGASMAAVGDVNGDGFVDIVTANGFVAGGQGVSLLLGNGDGSFQAARSTLTTGNPTYVAIADFNRDGKSDIVIVNGDNATTISVLFGNGDGSFQSPIDTVTGGSNTLAIADFNGDGKPDLVVTGTSNIVTVLLNNGDGTFTSSYAATIFGPGLLAGDFNRDGFADFVCGGAGGVLKLVMATGCSGMVKRDSCRASCIF